MAICTIAALHSKRFAATGAANTWPRADIDYVPDSGIALRQLTFWMFLCSGRQTWNMANLPKGALLVHAAAPVAP